LFHPCVTALRLRPFSGESRADGSRASAAQRSCPISYATHWLSSVVYVSALSLWALVAGHWSSWQAARVEVAQERQIEKQRDDPIEDKVLEKIVEKTDVAPSA
jgi:hypothetical protein